MISCYFKLLIFRPIFVISLITFLSLSCIILSLSLKKFPDFTDPTKGFEARGTEISKRLTAWSNLLEETRPSGSLMTNPNDLLPPPTEKPRKKHVKNKKKKKQKQTTKNENFKNKLRILKNLSLEKPITYDAAFGENLDEDNDFNETRREHWDYGKNVSYNEEKSKIRKSNKQKWNDLRELSPPPITAENSFCESPNKEFMHFVIKRVNRQINESLFEVNALWAMCELEQTIISTNKYENLCQKELSSDNCCRPWSLANYVALLSNKTSCFDISDDDVQSVKSLLFECYQYYSNLNLGNDCVETKCHVPLLCTQYNAVYNIFHFLADREFIKLNETAGNEYLSTAMIFFPVARSTKALPLFHNLMKKNLQNELVGAVAMDMGLKNALFDECLLLDGWLVALGGLFVLVCMWMYTMSFFVTFMTVIAIIFSLGIAYFIYTFVFKLEFFPFMNLLTVIVVVGIGSDDAFIFLKIWQCVLLERIKTATPSASPNNPYDGLVTVMGKTLKHASISMLVTSLTTASAFYASYVSSITAVRCFGIFAGTAVMSNYLLMITWLPATVSTAERFRCLNFTFLKNLKIFSNKMSKVAKFHGKICNKLEDIIISLILNYPVFWIVTLGGFGVVCGVFVLYWPKLKLPDSPDLKLFVEDHVFELYDTKYKELFWFEKIYTSSDSFKLPLRFVWGVQPIDNGNYLDPTSRGKLYLDDTFNVSAKESQQWLLDFCKNLKKQPFYQSNFGNFLLPNCFIENFITSMSRACIDSMSEQDRTPCCEVSAFPYSPEIFDYCLPESISNLYETPRFYFLPGVAGPKFEKPIVNETTGLVPRNNLTVITKVKAVVVESDSTQSFTMSFTEMYKFVQTIEGWFNGELEKAPVGMRNAFFISDLEFFDLQGTLSQGTLHSIGVAMSVALIVLILVTLNILVSLYAIITVTFTIFSIVGTLVLLGWKLNVLESIAVSTAIGLAVDFSLHYGVQYRYSTETDRKASTKCALQRMCGPTAMAALTTGVAGALMLPSNVLAYIQIGIFLVVSMTISWIFSTFFLMSLLSAVGPQFGFGQFKVSLPKFKRNAESNKNKNLKTQIDMINNTITQQSTASEQLLSASSSATCEFLGCSEETHELDSLTSTSLVKTLTIDSNSHPIIRPTSFDRSFKKKSNYPNENSPSNASAITVVLPDDSDVMKN